MRAPFYAFLLLILLCIYDLPPRDSYSKPLSLACVIFTAFVCLNSCSTLCFVLHTITVLDLIHACPT
ncbi:hypothetical protein EDB19DRAFT_399738 [Suillus lakei]|nr:hypothetical protein EDB19DRAFT_399738 [Suillus lakei]